MTDKELFNHDQLMDIAIAGFGKDDWRYNSRDLFEGMSSVAPYTHKVYMNGEVIMSMYFRSVDDVTFTASPKWRFNHMAAVKKLKKIIHTSFPVAALGVAVAKKPVTVGGERFEAGHRFVALLGTVYVEVGKQEPPSKLSYNAHIATILLNGREYGAHDSDFNFEF